MAAGLSRRRPGMLPHPGAAFRELDTTMPVLVIPYPAFDPVLVHLGPFAIRWYALAYIFGILIGWGYARTLFQSKTLLGGKAPMNVTDLDDFVLWVTVGIILGGRTVMCCSTTCRTLLHTRRRSCSYGMAACHFMAASRGVSSQSCCSLTGATSQFYRSGTSHARLGRSVCSSAALQISSMVNLGPSGRRALGNDISRRRSRCRDIRANFTRRRWRGCCCWWCLHY